jgi:ADP-ribosylation factor-binding protein GGA
MPARHARPREAVMLTARLANHRNPHIATLALALLDTLVQSCGYPLHLQIATKEFLNELVRRFPERPPAFPGPVMSRILELIHSWKEGICAESRWKDDLGNIRDMHRLLTFKGYRFRELPTRNLSENTMVGVEPIWASTPEGADAV